VVRVQEPPYEQLFDLQQDPAELHDLARDPKHRATLVSMRARCEQLRGEPLPRFQ
jgi:arylsulfatase A-like enzyme